MPAQNLSKGLNFILAVAVGIIAANLYYAQPLVALISQKLGIATEAAGLVVMLTQLGYGLGILFLVPLGDISENRRLILSMIFLSVLGLLGLAFAEQASTYFLAALLTGLGAASVQLIVPYATHFAAPQNRGQVVGSLMSGLMIGIMLSRPVASFITDIFSWHAVFVLSAALMTGLATLLYWKLPQKPPVPSSTTYKGLLKSMLDIYLEHEILRRRAIYQAFLFGAFCLFWTAVPLLLAGPVYRLSQTEIAVFALAGVSGAVVAPFAGRAADKGYLWLASLIAMTASSLSFVLNHSFNDGSTLALAVLVFSAILLDAGISANLVLGQRAIFSLGDSIRSRVNALYIATIFVGGAAGSSLGAWAYATGGWERTSWIGFAMPGLALLYFLTEKRIRVAAADKVQAQ